MNIFYGKISEKEKNIIRILAEKVADYSNDPVNEERKKAWQALNDLKPIRPMVYIKEEPWHELNVDDELTLLCTHPVAREVELNLRRRLYKWKHMPVDYVIDNWYHVDKVIYNTWFGINEESEKVKVDPSGVSSRKFIPQIEKEEDIEKIKFPEIYYDEPATTEKKNIISELLGGILNVRVTGIYFYWCSPWDKLVTWTGVENILMDIALRPDYVHRLTSRLMEAYLHMLKQWEELRLLDYIDGNYGTGSGGLAYTSELPGSNFNPEYIKPHNQWGHCAAQIFQAVSPEDHYEFALKYEIKWLEKFGLNYYGCCEPLDRKIDILRNIPRLRKVSVSPWADTKLFANNTYGEWVLSIKPNPAILAPPTWDPEEAKRELKGRLEPLKGYPFEVIMKDISTVNYQPFRLWEWARIAMEVIESFC